MTIEATTPGLHREILARAEALKPLPTTVVQLAAAVADEGSDVDDLVSILRRDPNLVATLLREANSAMSASISEIGTIEAAVTRLGSGRVLAIAMNASMSLVTPTLLAGYDISGDELREHAVLTSFIAEAVQSLARDRVGPEGVTAAFLHDIGKVLLDDFLDPRHFTSVRSAEADIIEVERELAEVDHAEVGALLLELWGIPPAICDAIRFHHHPQLAAGEPASVVALAGSLAHELDRTAAGSGPGVIDWALANLDLTRHQVMDRAEKVLRRAGLAGWTPEEAGRTSSCEADPPHRLP